MDSPFNITQIEVLYFLLFVIVKDHIFAFLILEFIACLQDDLESPKYD